MLDPTPFLDQDLVLVLVDDFARILRPEQAYRNVVILEGCDKIPHAGDELPRLGLEPSQRKRS